MRDEGGRRGIRDLCVGFLAQAGNTYCAHDISVYAYRHAAAQRRDAGGDERRSAPINVLLDLLRRPLQPRGRSCLLDGKVRACGTHSIHAQESNHIPA
jgi:hypothetical protein